jgi:hypothetical protein
MADAEVIDDRLRSCPQVGVREHYAFGKTGRTGRVDDLSDVVADARNRLKRSRRGNIVDVDDERGGVGPSVLALEERLRGYEHSCGRMAEDVFDLAGAKELVDDHGNSADSEDAEKRSRGIGAPRKHDRDPLVRSNACRV